ncbi:uncharacterized protein LOC119741960 [Patiria miniata]|uniref:Transmembrane protein n=1 Tax=Patiria miniata TaxID=46514 RepID=A0A914BCT5_PATMI|nr:uncharacterized protein LOC119741960 [Patiria miniata]
MGIGNILMLFQVTTYLLCTIFSFFVFAPMAVNKNGDFLGNCLLFATGSIVQEQIVISSWGPAGGCNFAIAVGVFAMLVSIAQLVRLSFHVYYETDSSFLGAFVTLIINAVMTIMVFASAINVTRGYSVWCQLINQVSGCSVAGIIPEIWTLVVYNSGPNFKPDNYAVEIGMVMFGLWTELLLWIVICIYSVVKLVKYHQQEHIFRSLGRERERLIGRYTQPDF